MQRVELEVATVTARQLITPSVLGRLYTPAPVALPMLESDASSKRITVIKNAIKIVRVNVLLTPSLTASSAWWYQVMPN